MAQLQLGRLAIHRLPIFLCSVKVKGTAYRVVGLRDMLYAALETSSLFSLGVVTPLTTPTTNLFFLAKSKARPIEQLG